MEAFAQTLSVPPPAASTAEFFALTSSSLRRAGCTPTRGRPLIAYRSTNQPNGGDKWLIQSYKVVEVVGTSNESISKAISRAISKAGATLRHLGWFEVVQIRGSIENNQIRQHQVTVKVGFTLEED